MHLSAAKTCFRPCQLQRGPPARLAVPAPRPAAAAAARAPRPLERARARATPNETEAPAADPAPSADAAASSSTPETPQERVAALGKSIMDNRRVIAVAIAIADVAFLWVAVKLGKSWWTSTH